MGVGADVSSSRDVMMYDTRMRFAATIAVSAAYVAFPTHASGQHRLRWHRDVPFQRYFWLAK